jgi:hypothetical protein
VGLEVRHVCGRHPGVGEGGAQHGLLRSAVGDGEPGGRAVVVHRHAADDAQHAVAARHGVGEAGEHEDPAIGSFLNLLEANIRSGQHVNTLPDDLVEAMLATLSHPADLGAEIDGDVAL